MAPVGSSLETCRESCTERGRTGGMREREGEGWDLTGSSVGQ